MNWYAFSPHDSLFFRDGQPFNQDDEGLNTADSRFPPAPSVVAGAFRASLARSLGWDPATGQSWTGIEGLKEILGDGPDDLGQLTFNGPVLARGNDLCFPAPRHLFVANKHEAEPSLLLVKPGDDVFSTDSGDLRLIGPVPRGFEPLEDYGLTAKGLEDTLSGKVPRLVDVIAHEGLWSYENRIGLGIDSQSRTASHGMLYQARHIRLDGNVSLALAVAGIPAGVAPANPSALGGFQRLADLKAITPSKVPGHQLGAIDQVEGVARYTVTLISPARLPDEGWAVPGDSLSSTLPGRIVTGMTDRLQWIGGWDGRPSVDGRYRFQGPLPLEPYVPAGSVWFMECAETELPDRWPTAIGERQEMGYGACLIGGWPKPTASKKEG